MRTFNLFSRRSLWALLLGWSMLFLSACSEDENPSPNDTPNPNVGTPGQVSLVDQGVLGQVLADTAGRTLYFFTRDVSGETTCTGGCADTWPAFYRDGAPLANGLNVDDFATITRPDGQLQTTYKGWPLYYYAPNGDGLVENPGQTQGEGVATVWFVAKPDYDLFIGTQDVGGSPSSYFVDDRGRTLYRFANDQTDVSNCNGGCAQVWPEFNSNNTVLPSTLPSRLLTRFTRGDGDAQTSLQGKPLYYYDPDQDGITEARGQTQGQGVNGVWFILEVSEIEEQGNNDGGY